MRHNTMIPPVPLPSRGTRRQVLSRVFVPSATGIDRTQAYRMKETVCVSSLIECTQEMRLQNVWLVEVPSSNIVGSICDGSLARAFEMDMQRNVCCLCLNYTAWPAHHDPNMSTGWLLRGVHEPSLARTKTVFDEFEGEYQHDQHYSLFAVLECF